MHPPVFIITGAMAAGKSTVAMALAKRFARSAHVEGDVFLRMMVKGRATIGPVLSSEARAQLSLRQELATEAARKFALSGFAVIYEDILIGTDLTAAVERLSEFSPHVVVLTPSVSVLAQRDQGRSKTGYSDSLAPQALAGALERETPRLGLWIDTSAMSADDVVTTILTRHRALGSVASCTK